MLFRKRWKGKYVVIERCQWRIGIRMDRGGGKMVDIWNVYLKQGKHKECLGKMEGGGKVGWLGDFNTWSRRWGGQIDGRNREGILVEEWLDEW